MIKFRPILRVLFTFIVLFGISFGFNPVQKTQAQTPTVHINSCQTLNQANTNYILDNDVQSAGTCFRIIAPGISLDLGGHTVTYNNQQGDISCGAYDSSGITHSCAYGVTIGDDGHWLNVNSDSYIKILNGSIVQGNGTGTYSHAILGRYTNLNNLEVGSVNITVHTDDSSAIKLDGSTGSNIHDNTITSNITYIHNRHAYDGYAMHLYPINANIYNNKIMGGQGGIFVGGSGAGNINIYSNDISHRALDTNGYGIMISNYGSQPIHDVKAYNNNIHTTDGCGIEIDGNYYNIEIYSNNINVQMGPKFINNGFGYALTAWGIKGRQGNQDVTGLGRMRVHDNIIVSTTKDGQVQDAAGIGIYDSGSNLNNEYYNNIITVSTDGSLVPIENPKPRIAAGIKNAGDRIGGSCCTGDIVSDSGTRISNNTITSNNYNIWLATEDGVGQNNLAWTSNTLIKGANPINYHTLRMGFWIQATQGHIFLDTKTLNGADIDDLEIAGDPGAPYSLYVKWYLDVLVKNASGQAIPGASVSAAATGGGAESPSVTTDANGRARLELTQYYRYGNTYPPTSNYTNYTPHNLTVSAAGYSPKNSSTTMDTSKEMAVVLGGTDGPVISNVVANVDQNAKTATITWSTDQSVASSVDYGLDTNYGTNKSGGTGTGHSATLTSLTSPATYHFRITAGTNQGVDHTFFLLAQLTQGLTLIKSADKTQVQSGQTITYTINYTTNQSTNNVVVTDPIPAGALYVSGSGKLNGIAKTDAADSDEFSLVGSVPTWNLGNLLSGATGNVSFQVRVNQI